MRSTIAGELKARQRQRVAAMTPSERVALAMRLGEEGVSLYMTTHDVDRRTAIARIKATRRIGRRASAAAADDD